MCAVFQSSARDGADPYRACGVVCRTAVHTSGSTRALEDIAMVNRYAKKVAREACVIVLLR